MSFVPGKGLRICRRGERPTDPHFVCDSCGAKAPKRMFEDVPSGWSEGGRGTHACTRCRPDFA